MIRQTKTSNLYLRVVKGEVSAKTYVEKIKKNVDRQIGKGARRANV